MKRRSARPFVVEIKNPPRPGRTEPPVLAGDDRTGGGLWHGLLAGEDAAPAAKPPAGSAPPPPDGRSGMPAPAARRILPNLMQQHPPDAAPEPAGPAAAPATRRRGPARTKPSAAASPASAPPNGPAPDAVPTVVAAPRPVSDARSVATGPVALPPAAASRLKPAQRRPEGLRPGERWKRRLPRFSR